MHQGHPHEKPLLFFLHGLGASSQSFRPLIQQLKNLEERFEFVAMEFWGFGGTQIPKSVKNVSIKAFAEQVMTEISKRSSNGRKPVHLIGHSMGGAVVVELHRLYPGIKIDSFVNLEGNLQLEDCTFSRNVAEQDRKEFLDFGFRSFKEKIRRLARQGDISAQDWILGLEKTTAEVFYDASADLFQVSANLYPHYRDWDARTIYVFGEKTLDNSQATYARLLQDGKNVAVIRDAGHVMMLEKPELTAEICLAQLRD